MTSRFVVGAAVDPNSKNPQYYEYGRPEMMKFIPVSATKILDVGCSSGAFGAAIKQEREAEVWGIEAISSVGQIAATRLDRVLIGDIERDLLELPTDFFDCVVFNDVLEHLVDPWTVLKRISTILRKDGCVVASIPNIRYLPTLKELVAHGKWEYTSAGILDSTHLRFFTKKSIPPFFSECGFKLVKVEGINPISLTWKRRLIYSLFGSTVSDTRYLQFACVATVILK